MFGNAFEGPHLLIVLAVVLLLFGATKLPALAKGVGQSIKIFRKEMTTDTPPPVEGEADNTAAPEATADKPADAEFRRQDPEALWPCAVRGGGTPTARCRSASTWSNSASDCSVPPWRCSPVPSAAGSITDLVWDQLRAPDRGHRDGPPAPPINYPSITSAFDLRIQVALIVGHRHLQPDLALPDLRLLRSRPDQARARLHLRILLHGGPAVPGRMRDRLVRAAAHRRADGDVRPARGHQHHRRQVLPRLRDQADPRDRHRLRAAGVPGAAELHRHPVGARPS